MEHSGYVTITNNDNNVANLDEDLKEAVMRSITDSITLPVAPPVFMTPNTDITAETLFRGNDKGSSSSSSSGSSSSVSASMPINIYMHNNFKKQMTPKELEEFSSNHQQATQRLARMLKHAVHLNSLQERAFSWILYQEAHSHMGCHGGLILDTAGVSKTLSMLTPITVNAMAVRKQCPHFLEQLTKAPWCNMTTQATLIIAKLSMMTTWSTHIKDHFKKGSLHMLVYHSSKCNKTSTYINELLTGHYDVILTTYTIIQDEFFGTKKRKKGTK
jgi:hypothetical protein